ncbi:VQ motif-containing protein [Quillaja saponaria]|uniref:VQ motif-containing protein n=1 Tax=Quillaja saponaria TaxID=32244 RepID=A0AAD7LUP1_QUISA|nr:VQ motif-containing protein [Quillaja saponaria]
MSNQNDWLQFYHQQNYPSLSNAAAITTATATTVTPEATNSLSGLNPEGRVSKPIRRRSRTSRRTPTTLLNTDTTNFRAMVQQFTGGPCNAPFQAPGVSSNLGFGFGPRHQAQLNSGGPGAMGPPPVFQLYQQQQQNQPYMFSVNSGNNNNMAGNGGGGGFVMDHGHGGGRGGGGGGFFPS